MSNLLETGLTLRSSFSFWLHSLCVSGLGVVRYIWLKVVLYPLSVKLQSVKFKITAVAFGLGA